LASDQRIARTVNQPERARSGMKGAGEEAGQYRCGDFVPGVGEEARRANAGHTWGQPLLLIGFDGGEILFVVLGHCGLLPKDCGWLAMGGGPGRGRCR